MLANQATSENWKKIHCLGCLWLTVISENWGKKNFKLKFKKEKSNWFKIVDFYPHQFWSLTAGQQATDETTVVTKCFNCFKDTTTTSRSVKTVCPPDLEVGRVVCWV